MMGAAGTIRIGISGWTHAPCPDRARDEKKRDRGRGGQPTSRDADLGRPQENDNIECEKHPIPLIEDPDFVKSARTVLDKRQI